MTNFSNKILHEIDNRKAKPKPRWYFFLKHLLFWFMAVLSVVMGAIAVSTLIYVFLDNDGLSNSQNPALQEIIIDIAQNIPYIWLFILGLFTASAYRIFRKTRHGYRYTTVLVLGLVISTSIVLGLLLSTIDFGEMTHRELQKNYTLYDALIYSREDTAD